MTTALEAVVFDFDGLVIDSEWVIYESAQAAFALHGHDLPVAAWATIVGLGAEEEAQAWATLLAAAEIEAFDVADYTVAYEAQDRSNRHTLPALPGVEVLLDSLLAAGVPVGMASSSTVSWLERHLNRLGLREGFSAVVGRDVVGGVGKPAPDVYLRACAELGADPARSVALEDSRVGVAAAKAAGMAVVAVPGSITRFNDLTQADRIVESLEHVTLADLDLLVTSSR